MNDNKVALVAAVVALALGGFSVYRGAGNEGGVNINITPEKTNVSVAAGAPGAPGQNTETVKEYHYGSAAGDTTNWTAGSFSEDLTVGKITTFNGTSTIIGPVFGAVQQATSTAFTQSGQSLCSIQNKTGDNRILEEVGLLYATNTATGGASQYFTISISTSAATTGTGADLLVDQGPNWSLAETRQALVGATSTLDTARVIWRAGSYVNFLNSAPTSTISGKCIVKYSR